MIDAETQAQINEFLKDLKDLTTGDMIPMDYSFLYERHPKVRLCIRRAFLALRKTRTATSSSSVSS